MRSEWDDGTLTAYVLGELGGVERASVEDLLAVDGEARREVEEIGEAAAALGEAFALQPGDRLTPAQRFAIEAAAMAPLRPRVARKRRFFGNPYVDAAAVAATVAVIALAYSLANSVPSLFRAQAAPSPRSAFFMVWRPESGSGQEASKTYEDSLPALAYVGAGRSKLDEIRRASAPFTTNDYSHTPETPFILVAQDPRSTFSVDVDTASYSIVRRFLNGGERPPKDAVRIEELVNYFPYPYAPPTDGRPFAVHMDVAACPWKPGHRLVRIALKGREVPPSQRPPANLVFLLDVSGSMDAPDKLPLVQAAMRLLVDELGPRDHVAIVVYAGASGLALPSTPATDKETILSAIRSLSPGGTTHGSAGIRLAYETATANFIGGGVNRVILATDGDFNVGVTSQGALLDLIEREAQSGVFLTALGFGMGNLKDSTLETLADHGNGNYAYIDSPTEARKSLVEQLGATLVTIAKDVKLQVEFNPRRVKAFRLIGYDNRVLAHQDFNDDRKDAGEIGAGHTVTAFYEIVPPGGETSVPPLDPLKYQEPPRPGAGPDSGELLTLKLRYKEPDGDRSSLIEVPLPDESRAFEDAPADFRFGAAVAAFGMVLRNSPDKGDASLEKALDWARASVGEDPGGYRNEFLRLVEKARSPKSSDATPGRAVLPSRLR
jgi:Ca-activated chloride channel family protein